MIGSFLIIWGCLLSIPGSPETKHYVGALRCKSCHESAYQAYSKTAHARAFSSLVGTQRTDPTCIACHSIAQEKNNPNLLGVQCESCHGPGQYYTSSYVMKDKELSRLLGLVEPSEKMCQTCHDAHAPNIQPFSYAEAKKKITHK